MNMYFYINVLPLIISVLVVRKIPIATVAAHEHSNYTITLP